MSKLPFMPWFVDAHLAATRLFSPEQDGALRRILDYLWMNDGWAPCDHTEIAKIVGVSRNRWIKHIKPKIWGFFTVIDEKFTNNRLLEQYDISKQKSLKSSTSGSLGGKATALKYKNLKEANATASAPLNAEASATKSLGQITQALVVDTLKHL